MFTIHDFLAAGAVPAAVAALVLTLGWRTQKRALGRSESPMVAAELAVALGFATGWVVLFGPADFPPSDTTWWLLWASVPLGAMFSLARWGEAPFEARVILAGLATAVLFALVAWPLVSLDDIEGRQIGWRVAAGVGLATVAIFGMEVLGERLTFRRTLVVEVVATAAAAFALWLAGSERLARAETLLASVCLGGLATTLWVGRAGNGSTLAAIVGVLHGGILLCGNLYEGLGAGSTVLLLFAPCAAWAGEPLAFHRFGAAGLRRATLQVALVAATAAIAVWITWRNSAAATP
jgi:hypothetical protein